MFFISQPIKTEISEGDEEMEATVLRPAGMSLRPATFIVRIYEGEDLPRSRHQLHFFLSSKQILILTLSYQQDFLNSISIRKSFLKCLILESAEFESYSNALTRSLLNYQLEIKLLIQLKVLLLKFTQLASAQRGFFGGGGDFSKIFKKIYYENCKNGIILTYQILRKFQNIFKSFFMKIAKNVVF